MIIGDINVVRGKYDTVFVSRRSFISGKLHTMALAVDYNHLVGWMQNRASGAPTKLIQDEFPFLNNAEREFLLTGATDEEWHATFANEEDDDPIETEGSK